MGILGKYLHFRAFSIFPCFSFSNGFCNQQRFRGVYPTVRNMFGISQGTFFFSSIFPGSLWSLVGAMLYAVYIVMIKRKVDREDKLDIPMFFGKTKSNSVEGFNSMCDKMICFQAVNCEW